MRIAVPARASFCGTRLASSCRAAQQEIEEIQGRYPYRRKCYKKARRQWLPVPLEKQPRDYEEKVEEESIDPRDDFVRG